MGACFEWVIPSVKVLEHNMVQCRLRQYNLQCNELVSMAAILLL